MSTPFILRFEEVCTDEQIQNSDSGTKTMTNVRAESTDSDWNRFSYGVIKHKSIMAGTATRTFASAEGSDDDRDYRAFQITPLESVPVSGTQTLTRIRAEGPDDDQGSRQFCIIPSCSLS